MTDSTVKTNAEGIANAMGAEELVEVYGDLSSTDLAKQINDDYAAILGNERANLPRALALAPKLYVLRTRAWGQWKTKFPSHNLQMSYETASVYLRIWQHWNEIQRIAVKKGVEPTHLTIDAARELWASRNVTEEDDGATDTTDSDEEDGGNGQKYDDLEAHHDESDEDIAIEWLDALAPDELVHWIGKRKDDEWQRDFFTKFAAHLKITLYPMKQTAGEWSKKLAQQSSVAPQSTP